MIGYDILALIVYFIYDADRAYIKDKSGLPLKKTPINIQNLYDNVFAEILLNSLTKLFIYHLPHLQHSLHAVAVQTLKLFSLLSLSIFFPSGPS